MHLLMPAPVRLRPLADADVDPVLALNEQEVELLAPMISCFGGEKQTQKKGDCNYRYERTKNRSRTY